MHRDRRLFKGHTLTVSSSRVGSAWAHIHALCTRISGALPEPSQPMSVSTAYLSCPSERALGMGAYITPRGDAALAVCTSERQCDMQGCNVHRRAERPVQCAHCGRAKSKGSCACALTHGKRQRRRLSLGPSHRGSAIQVRKWLCCWSRF